EPSILLFTNSSSIFSTFKAPAQFVKFLRGDLASGGFWKFQPRLTLHPDHCFKDPYLFPPF
ncbi:unnamed protein product, partial [Larinioides sclopetarius]